MGFEPTILRDLVGCPNHWATGDSVVSKGRIVGIYRLELHRAATQPRTGSYDLTNSIALLFLLVLLLLLLKQLQ